MTTTRYQLAFFYIILAAVLFLMFSVVRPYIVAVFIAFVCYVAFKGYHERLERKIKNRTISSALAVLTVILVIVVPICAVGVLVFFEARDLYTTLASSGTPGGLLNSAAQRVEQLLSPYVPGINIDIPSYLRAGLDWLISHLSVIFTSFLNFFVDLMIMLFALFYLFKDGKKLRSFFMKLSPLDEDDDSNILGRLELTIGAVLRGSFIIALIQGTLTAIGFTIFGIGQPVLWGLVAAFAALIPGVGTALVTIPAVLFLFFSGNVAGAIGYAIWGAVAIGAVDNFLSPQLVERRVNIHPFLILISVLGGLLYFGPIGFLAGPIILALAAELIKMYPRFGGSQGASSQL